MTQVVYGWNLSVLRNAIEGAIRSTGYEGKVSINFEVRANKVVVRPDSGLSRALSNVWLRILLMITFVHPFIWLYKRICGGRWTVAGSAYALNRWEQPLGVVQSGTPSNCPGMVVSVQESEWFRMWEPMICHLVMDHRFDKIPMYDLSLSQAP
jgi:hypothetical protein